MPRKIIHVDLDAFFCSVEELLNPSLKGKAFAVGGRPDTRGVVASCSYAARMKGIHSAMPMARAVRLCPDLIIVSGRHGLYSDYSKRVMAHFYQLTPLVEPVSIDEAFLDVSDLPDSGLEIARRLQRAIHQEPGLPCSIGVATNKLVAKLATDAGKAANRGPNPPNAITVVPPGEEASFMKPFPVSALWGVGPKTAARLAGLGISTIADLAQTTESVLAANFGKNGLDMLRHSRGIDESAVYPAHDVKSISQEVTFDHDMGEKEFLFNVLRSLSEEVGARLREQGLVASSVKLKLRWPDFTTITRQTTLAQAVDQDSILFTTASQLFSAAWQPGKLVRLVGVGVSGLAPAVRQLGLWDTTSEKESRLLGAIDDLRMRYGKGIIGRGTPPTGGDQPQPPSKKPAPARSSPGQRISEGEPPAPKDSLPFSNTYWVVPGRLLAGPYPGGEDDHETRARLHRLIQAGVTAIINLTEPGEYQTTHYQGLFQQLSSQFQGNGPARCYNFPIPDRTTPTLKEMTAILETIETALADGYNLYLHCYGGVGRTGTVVGCYLVSHGFTGQGALDQIRRWRSSLPGGNYPSPETVEQRAMVLSWG